VPRGAFTSGYTAADVAKLLGLSLAQIQAYQRAGVLSPRRGAKGEHRFSLADLVLLRTAKELSERVPARKVRRALLRLREQLPHGRPLTGVRITAEGDDVVVRDGASAWEPESGQALLSFEVSELASRVAPLARRAAERARNAEAELSAPDWYEMGCDMEPHDALQARDCYRRALELDPAHPGARVNLGRLLQEAGLAQSAEAHYRLALRANPGDVTAAFNLGVALEDLGRPQEAIEAYEKAVAADPGCADAHYNVARLYERFGRRTTAFRHLKTYKQLTEDR
jgi:tetratricopeptide (TPR) repeat protein